MADRIAYGQPQTGNQGFARTMKTLGGVIALLATDMAANNNTQMPMAKAEPSSVRPLAMAMRTACAPANRQNTIQPFAKRRAIPMF